MVISILTLFPQNLKEIFSFSILKRAQEKKLLQLYIHDIRRYASDNYGTVDGKQYGGGVGMLLRVDVVHKALKAAKKDYRGKGERLSFLLDPGGLIFNQNKARELSEKSHIILVCGHYEGFDARIAEFVDGRISIGKFVLTGGELPAGIVVDAITRLLPGVLKDPLAVANESFSEGILAEAPQYTRPENYLGLKVPAVLLSGNHAKIRQWRESNTLKK